MVMLESRVQGQYFKLGEVWSCHVKGFTQKGMKKGLKRETRRETLTERIVCCCC